MKNHLSTLVRGGRYWVAGALIAGAFAGVKGQTTFNYTGAVQSYTVPVGVTTINVDAMGGDGYGPEGRGGRVQCDLAVTPGEVLYIYVGGQGTDNTGGYNGGGTPGTNANYGGGGGGTDIRRGGTTITNRILVAGGGGGSASNCGTWTAEGGHGGGLVGGSGCVFSCSSCQYTGSGGTQSAGGIAGPTSHGSCGGNTNGALWQGGSNTGGFGVGGGGGYYGGGSGCFEGAGGGSSYTDFTCTNVVHTQGYQTGDGRVIFNLLGCAAPSSVTASPATACAGSSVNLNATSTGNTIYWYTVSSGGVSIGNSASGANFAVSPSTTTTYWAEATGSCQTSSRVSVTVTVNASPTASNAGPDQTACSPNLTLAANSPSVGTGAWSIISGTGGSFSNSASPTSGFTMTPGNTYTLRWTISNSPCPASTDDVVISPDNIAPVISCPSNVSTNNGSGQCGAVVSYAAPSATDNCTATTSQTSGMSSGATFPGGVTTNTFVATDAFGNTSSCSFTVTVSDNTAPVINCPGNLSQNTSPGLCNATVTFGSPSATDNCTLSSVTQTGGPGSGSVFLVGTTALTFQAQDAAGNTSTCTYNVVVTDNQAPSALCQSDSLTLGGGGSGSITASDIDGGSTDNCGVQSITASVTNFTCSDIGTNSVVLTITDVNGNTSSCTAIVYVVAAPLAVAMQPNTNACGYNVTCAGGNDGVASANATGGCGALSYIWSNGQTLSTATGLGAGVHTVTVTDANGNTSTSSVTITAPAAFVVSATATSSCADTTNGTAAVTASGGNDCQNYTFLWSNGSTASTLSGLAPGAYTVTVTDAAGCTSIAAATVQSLPAPLPTISQNGNLLSSVQTWVTYQWLLNGTPIPGATASTHNATVSGSYSLVVTDNNGCEGVSAVLQVTVVGIEDAGEWNGLALFPNPTKDVFYLRSAVPVLDAVKMSGCTTSLGGAVSKDLDGLGQDVAVNIAGLAAGTYMVEVSAREGKPQTGVMVVQH
ncbi:MAG: HYR domain-containing protein [Bacteroidia bacterium]